MTLTDTETRLLRSIQERERLTLALYLEPVGRDWRATLAEVEARLGLPAGAIGTTHRIDSQTGAVTGPPEPTPEPEPTHAVDPD